MRAGTDSLRPPAKLEHAECFGRAELPRFAALFDCCVARLADSRPIKKETRTPHPSHLSCPGFLARAH